MGSAQLRVHTKVPKGSTHRPTRGRFSDILIRFPRGEVVERRGQKYHRERLGEALREEIETIVEGELGDPRIGLVNVSSVELAEDARSAHVLVQVEGNETEAQKTLQGLTAAVGFIRHEIAERLHLRRPPELFFRLDESQKYESRIDELLSRAKKSSK
jgi:ribosome-binding factor A